MLSTENAMEEARGRTFAMYKPATVNGIVGWCSWQYGMMLTIDSFEVQP
jgi:hypothetical protein